MERVTENSRAVELHNLSRWRRLLFLVMNRKRRFRYTADLSARSEAEALLRRNLQQTNSNVELSAALENEETQTQTPNAALENEETQTPNAALKYEETQTQTPNAALEIEETQTQTPNAVQGDETGAGMTAQQQAHGDPEAGLSMLPENSTPGIVLVLVICILQTAASGVIAYLQGSNANQTPGKNGSNANQTPGKNHRFFLKINILLMCLSYLIAAYIIGLYLFGRKIPKFRLIVKILTIGALGSLTSAVVWGVIFYLRSS